VVTGIQALPPQDRALLIRPRRAIGGKNDQLVLRCNSAGEPARAPSDPAFLFATRPSASPGTSGRSSTAKVISEISSPA